MKNDLISSLKDDMYIFTVLAKRKTRELCLGWPFLVLLVSQQLAFFFMQREALGALERDGIMVVFHPAQYGLLISVVLLGVFLLLYAAAEPARERESGALETIFYGPVCEGIYLFAILTAVIAAILVSFLCLLGSLLVGVIFIGYEIPTSLLPLLPVSFFCFLCVSAAGIFISALIRQARLTLITVCILLIFSLAASLGNFLFSRIDFPGTYAMIFFRRALSVVNAALGFIFPLGLYFEDLSWFIEFGRIPPFHIFWYLLYGTGLFFFSVMVLAKRGVLAR
jgi:ABC-type transport system involved in multi-copper enzyme maturation permease subunit